jgi:hypothetical protein
MFSTYGSKNRVQPWLRSALGRPAADRRAYRPHALTNQRRAQK